MPLIDFFWNGPVGASIVVLDQLEDTTSSKTFQRLCRVRLTTSLDFVNRVADLSRHLGGKCDEVTVTIAAEPEPSCLRRREDSSVTPSMAMRDSLRAHRGRGEHR